MVVVIFYVCFEVWLQFVDVGGQQCNLYFWVICVVGVVVVIFDDVLFFDVSDGYFDFFDLWILQCLNSCCWCCVE